MLKPIKSIRSEKGLCHHPFQREQIASHRNWPTSGTKNQSKLYAYGGEEMGVDGTSPRIFQKGATRQH